MKRISLIFILALYGCATHVIPQPIGGSSADGNVVVAFQYGLFEKPTVDWVVANQSALEHCIAWGYKNSKAFSGAQNICVLSDAYGNCMRRQVTVTYQCTN